MRSRPLLISSVLAFLALATGALAAEVKVAVAANFAEPAQVIAQRFKARTGHDATLSIGASGQFYTQIANGAPFGVFLSADRERPEAAEAAGLGVVGSRFTYAVGRLVLYSKTPGLVDARGSVLKSGRFEKLAIADPRTAPYGIAAVETMTALGVEAALRPKLVRGTSITQAYQFVDTGAAELGFVALSQVATVKGGSRWTVPKSYHSAIDQQAVLVKAGAGNPAATAFMTFLKGAEAKAIIRRYGYEVP